MKAISGELTPSAGKVTINGRDTRKPETMGAALKRGVLPQSTVISFPFTVREIVRLGLEAAGSGKAVAGDRTADEALEAVDLAGFSAASTRNFRAGEQQRVQLARGPLPDPGAGPQTANRAISCSLSRVSSLDIATQLTIMRLARHSAPTAAVVVAVMHDLNLTSMFADQIVMMKAGRIRARGAPKERADRRDHGSGLRLPHAGERRSGTGYPFVCRSPPRCEAGLNSGNVRITETNSSLMR